MRYNDNASDKNVTVLGVYTHEEQAMVHALEFVKHDSIGKHTKNISPPNGYIFDAEVKSDENSRICIIKSQMMIGIKKDNKGYNADMCLGTSIPKVQHTYEHPRITSINDEAITYSPELSIPEEESYMRRFSIDDVSEDIDNISNEDESASFGSDFEL